MPRSLFTINIDAIMFHVLPILISRSCSLIIFALPLHRRGGPIGWNRKIGRGGILSFSVWSAVRIISSPPPSLLSLQLLVLFDSSSLVYFFNTIAKKVERATDFKRKLTEPFYLPQCGEPKFS